MVNKINDVKTSKYCNCVKHPGRVFYTSSLETQDPKLYCLKCNKRVGKMGDIGYFYTTKPKNSDKQGNGERFNDFQGRNRI